MLHFTVVYYMETRFKMILKEQSSAGKYTCVFLRLCLGAVHPSADTSRHSGTFNQPGVKHAEGQMRRTLRSSGAEIMLRCLFAWFSCAATRRHPSEPQLVFFCNLLFLLSCVFDVGKKALCGSSPRREQKPMLTTQSMNAYSSCRCSVIR